MEYVIFMICIMYIFHVEDKNQKQLVESIRQTEKFFKMLDERIEKLERLENESTK